LAYDPGAVVDENLTRIGAADQNGGQSDGSGSFRAAGMVVAPCSIKTLSGIVTSYSDNLLLRAADVTLKERLRLVLLVRETPLHLGHLRLLVQVTEMGAVVMPPTGPAAERAHRG
jgi:4-hydroxy-3-polyprenylbenzoate decarboxylase